MNSTSSEGQEPRKSNVVPVEVLGVSFTIRTDEKEEYIQGLVQELKDRLSRISSQMRIADPLKLALVNSLLILDELRREPGAESESDKDMEAATLLQDLDKRLGELGL